MARGHVDLDAHGWTAKLFSMSPRAQYNFSYRYWAPATSRGRLVTTKRGLAPFLNHSALATTRRVRLQDSRVR